MADSRIERDSFGPIEVPADRLWATMDGKLVFKHAVGTMLAAAITFLIGSALGGAAVWLLRRPA